MNESAPADPVLTETFGPISEVLAPRLKYHSSVIIIEGPDDSGKSTLCNHLHQELHMPVIRPHRNWGGWLESSHWYENLPSHAGIIFDRFPAISEPVYGPILRPSLVTTPWPGSEAWEEGLEILKAMNPIIIFSFAQAGSWKRPQLDGVVENNELIVAAYVKHMHEYSTEHGLTVLEYDHRWHQDQVNELVDTLYVKLQERQR